MSLLSFRLPDRSGRSVCAVLLFACLLAGAVRAQDAGWLYQVDVPVADQSAAARQQAARDGLAIVLMRVTGLARVPDDARVRSAIRNPEPYYNQFSYQAGAAPGELLLRLQFTPAAVFRLVRETALPVWPSTRPQVLVWTLVDQGGELRIPPAGSGDPVERAMLSRAGERGLVLRLATLRLPVGAQPVAAGDTVAGATSENAAGAAAIVAAVEAPEREPQDLLLRPGLPDGTPVWPVAGYWHAGLPEWLALSRPAAADLRVIARLHGAAERAWRGSVEIHDPNAQPAPEAAAAPAPVAGGAGTDQDAAEPAAELAPAAEADPAPVEQPPARPVGPTVLQGSGATPEALAASLVDRVVEYLLGRYQVVAGDASAVTVIVDGVRTAPDYAAVQRLFSRVEVIDDVAVLGAMGERLVFALKTSAAPEQLAALVTADGRLAAGPAAADLQPLPDLGAEAGALLQLRWQGR